MLQWMGDMHEYCSVCLNLYRDTDTVDCEMRLFQRINFDVSVDINCGCDSFLCVGVHAAEAYRKEEMKLSRVYEEVLELRLKQAKDQYEDERKANEEDKWMQDTKRRIDNQRVNTYIEVLKKTGADDELFKEIKSFVDKLWKKE